MKSGDCGNLGACVHCGFCMENCATYRATGLEANGPRGRISLIRQVREGRLDISDSRLGEHMDRCLGCGACEPVCPSGVRYREALAWLRCQQAQVNPPPGIACLINAIMAEPTLHRAVFGVARFLRPLASTFSGRSQLGFAIGMLAATKPWSVGESTEKLPSIPTKDGEKRDAKRQSGTVAIFEGCVMSGLFSHIHAATARTLEVNDYSVAKIGEQQCCGALHLHSGQRDEAIRLARKNIEAFSVWPDSSIAVNSAGCGAMLKEYGSLLKDDPMADQAAAFSERVRDVSELLAERGPREGESIRISVAYDPPCHLLHAQGVGDPPKKLLNAIPGLELLYHKDPELCCGSAGSYSFAQSKLSRQVLALKAKSILDVAPDLVASGNPGCIMQIGAGLSAAGSKLAVVHPIEILDRSYARAGFYE